MVRVSGVPYEVSLENPEENTQSLSKIQSPCVNICQVFQGTHFCKGCGRSVMEIELWEGYSDPMKAAIIEKSKTRLEVLNGKV
jgi:predicted Fe-S protein YdhL (DUF1289 family)